MLMSAKEHSECLVISIHEKRIDAAVAMRFKDRVRDLSDHSGDRVILDLSEVEFLDSSGLGAVVASMKHLGAKRRMDLAGLTPAVDKVFRMTRMDTVFRIFPDAVTAIGDIAHAS